MSSSDQPASALRTDVAHAARMYDYFLGGTANFPADRAAAEKILEIFPSTRIGARANRRFLGRAVRYAADRGIGQFLDIGTGIPTEGNTHVIAQQSAPDARVVYVDNDPIVLAHAQALLTSSTAEGRTAYLQADLRRPARILAHPALRQTLDLGRPVALVLVAILHFLAEEDEPHRVVRELLDALPSGSMLLVTHGTQDFLPETAREFMAAYARSGVPIHGRTKDEVARFFDGLDLVEPGVVPYSHWRPETEEDRTMDPATISGYAAVGVKP